MIRKTAEKQKYIVPSLLAADASSGCDSVPELYGLGKKSVCSLLQKYSLQHLAEASADISDVIQEGKTFITAHYGITNTGYVRNHERFLKCLKTYYNSSLYGSY